MTFPESYKTIWQHLRTVKADPSNANAVTKFRESLSDFDMVCDVPYYFEELAGSAGRLSTVLGLDTYLCDDISTFC